MPALVETKYEGDSGRIYALKLTAAYAAAAGTAPTGAVNDELNPKISKSVREYGLKPRGVRLSRTIGTAPDTFKKYTFLPVLAATVFVSPAFAKGATVDIGGVSWVITTKVGEDFN